MTESDKCHTLTFFLLTYFSMKLLLNIISYFYELLTIEENDFSVILHTKD